MKKIVILAVVFYCLFATALVPSSRAAIYKYYDKDGIICFANDLQVIPERYRASAVIVKGEAKEEPAKTQTPAAVDSVREQPAAPAPESPQKPVAHSLSYRLAVSGCVVIASLLVFMIIRRQAALKENKKMISLIRNALIGMISLYLLIAHGNDVMTMVGRAGSAMDSVQQQSAERGKKAAQTLKKLDVLFDEAQKAEEVKNQPGTHEAE